MPRQISYLQRRGYGLTFRIAVPPDLRSIVGAREFTKALPTANLNQAVPMALEYAACAKRLFGKLRAAMGTSDSSEKKSQSIDPDKLRELIRETKHRLKISNLEEQHQDELTEQRLKHLNELKIANLEVEIKTLNRALVRASASTTPFTAPSIITPSAAPVSGPVPTFHQVVAKFLDEYPKSKNPSMFSKHMTALPMLREFIGDIPVTQLRQAHINDFFALLQKLPPRWKDQCRIRKLTVSELAELEHPETLGPKTFDDTYKASIRPFLDDAVTNWQDSGFPTTITLKSTKYKGEREEGEDKQRAFKPSELKHLFEGIKMKLFADDLAQDHCYWLPHVGLYTGARVNEVCQLNPQTDILKDLDTGIWYFWITEETDGDERINKSTKNDESRRKVPIHSKLIELGFLSYIEKVKKAGAKLIFPAWKPSRGKASGEAEKWFRQLIVDTDLRDETKGARIVGFHAYRHTLENKGENTKGLPWPIEHITGHAIPGKSKVARGYSGELDLKNKQEIMEAISFDVDFHIPSQLTKAISN